MFKSKLNEFAQKNNLDLPIYNTTRLGGDDHNAVWVTTINFNNMTIKSEPNKSKKDCENEVAKKIYDSISEKKIQEYKMKTLDMIDFTKYKNIMLIDVENVDFNLDPLKYVDTLFILFMSKNSTKRKMLYLNDNENCLVLITDSVISDASDHYLTFTLGQLTILLKNIKYYVYTKDHYGAILEKLVPNLKFICSLDEFI